ncbi:MAG: hypothetical protein ABSF15_01805 [Candidatus Sulfotelmatobacter sp.]
MPGLERIHSGSSHFVADGKRITIHGNEPGHGVRCYLVDLNRDKIAPATSEGITGGLVSPGGQYIIANDGPIPAVYLIGGNSRHPVPSLEPALYRSNGRKRMRAFTDIRLGRFQQRLIK